MKFLEDVSLSALNAFLSAVNVGDYVVHGQLEAYSCASLPPRRSSDASTPGKTRRSDWDARDSLFRALDATNFFARRAVRERGAR